MIMPPMMEKLSVLNDESIEYDGLLEVNCFYLLLFACLGRLLCGSVLAFPLWLGSCLSFVARFLPFLCG